MEPLFAGDNVLVFDGQDRSLSVVLADALEFLLTKDIHRLDVEIALIPREGLVGRAWWAGGDVGFCGEAHPDATAVTVVNLPKGMV